MFEVKNCIESKIASVHFKQNNGILKMRKTTYIHVYSFQYNLNDQNGKSNIQFFY